MYLPRHLFFLSLLKMYGIVHAGSAQVQQHLLEDSGNSKSAKWGFDVRYWAR